MTIIVGEVGLTIDGDKHTTITSACTESWETASKESIWPLQTISIEI